MKTNPTTLLAAALLMTIAGNAQSQIITWTGPFGISSSSSTTTANVIVPAGATYLDGLKGAANGAPSPLSISNGAIITNFYEPITNPYQDSSGIIQLSGTSGVGTGTDGGAGTSYGDYNTLLSECAFTPGTALGTVTLNGLTNGGKYQVEIWNVADPTTYFTGASQALSTDYVNVSNGYVVGTFTAGGASEAFYWQLTTGHGGSGTISAIDLYELPVPEPSTYALMLGGLALLGFRMIRKSRQVQV